MSIFMLTCQVLGLTFSMICGLGLIKALVWIRHDTLRDYEKGRQFASRVHYTGA